MLAISLIIGLIIALAVLIHYEFLHRISILIPRMTIKHRFRIVFAVFGALIAHSLEVWIFSVAYYLLPQVREWGYLDGNFDGSLMDFLYFSYTTFTTLGFGDIEPHGHIRHLVGLESLTGLLLITWTASFLYYEMQRYWDRRIRTFFDNPRQPFYFRGTSGMFAQMINLYINKIVHLRPWVDAILARYGEKEGRKLIAS